MLQNDLETLVLRMEDRINFLEWINEHLVGDVSSKERELIRDRIQEVRGWKGELERILHEVHEV